EWRMQCRGPDAIEPAAPVLGAWCGERRARDLLGVETAGRPLRRILSFGQGAGQRLGGRLVSKTGKGAKPWVSPGRPLSPYSEEMAAVPSSVLRDAPPGALLSMRQSFHGIKKNSSS